MNHPVAIVGAGPIGLAAAATPPSAAWTSSSSSPGPTRRRRRRVGPRAAVLGVARTGRPGGPARCSGAGTWAAPDPTPTRPAGEWREQYLQPLADLLATPPGQCALRRRGVGVSRAGRDLLVDAAAGRPVRRARRDAAGRATHRPARWWTPPAPTRAEPAGRRRLPALGERETPTGSPTASPTSTTRASPRGTPASMSPRREGRVRPGRAGRPDQARGHTRAPASRGSCAVPPSVTRSEAATTTSSSERGRLGQAARAAAESGVGHRGTRFRTESVATQPDGRLTVAFEDGQQVTTSTRSSS